MHKITIPTALSFVAPGLGQLFTGHWLWALFWFIITPGFWIGTGGLAGLLCHFICAWQTHKQGSK
jgi:hypothetical protein